MRWPRVRFKIWNLMIVVAAAAGLLAAALSPIGLFVAFGLAYLALIGVLWWMFHGFRRVSALCFGFVAALSNVATAGLCIYRLSMGGVFLMLLVWLLAFPLVFSAGAAWATTATRREARSQSLPHSGLGRWLSHWASFRSRCSSPLGRYAWPSSPPRRLWIAWRIASLPVRACTSPEWAGLFRVVGSTVEPSNGNVGLIIVPDPSGRSGFVRVGALPGVPVGRSGRSLLQPVLGHAIGRQMAVRVRRLSAMGGLYTLRGHE